MRKPNRVLVLLFAFCFVMTQIVFVSPVFAASTSTGTSRIAGEDRYKTAVAVSQKGWKTADYAVLARGDSFADALCAGPLASKFDGPILLTQPRQLNTDTLQELKRLGVRHLFIAGGLGAVSQKVEDDLKAAGITDIERVYGNDRYETSVKIAEKIDDSGTVVLATGNDFPDALSISVIASKLQMPILLTPRNSIPDAVKDYLSEQSITKTYIAGGIGVIGSDIEQQVPGPTRLAGTDRYKTNVAILKNFETHFSFDNIYFATGTNFADALTGAVLAAKKSSPLILANKDLPAATADFLKDKILISTKPIGIGGQNALPSSIVTGILSAKENIQVSEKYNIAGTYGPETGSVTIEGSVIISAADVTLRNTIIEGDLLLGHSIGDGNVYLSDVTVKGKTIVNGGGPNSVIMYNFNGETVVIDIPDGGNVRLVAQGNTSIGNVSMESGGQLEESGLTGDGFTNVEIPAGAEVILSGDFNEVSVEADGANINLANGASITTLNANAPASITGEGQITTANVNVNGVTLGSNPTNLNIADEVTAVIDNEEKTPSDNTSTPPPSSGGGSGAGGGGGGGDTTAPTVNTYSPADNAINVAIDANLVLTFSEYVQVVDGKNITIKKTSDNSEVETIVANNNASITVVSKTVTIDLTNPLANDTGYYVLIDQGAFKDSAGNSYAGINSARDWNFRTVLNILNAPALTNGVSFADDDANDNATIITLGAPSVVGNTFVYKISDNDEAVSTPNVGDDLSAWAVVANGASIVTTNGKHIGVAEIDDDSKAVQFSDATAVVEAEAVQAPALVNGLNFADDDANDNATIITLGAPSVVGNTFVYKISDNDEAVSTPNVGDDLSAWTAVINGASIVATNGKHIGLAEIDGDSKAVQFSDATAIVEAEAVQAPALTNGVSFADDDANDNATIITLGAPSVVGNTFAYKISDDDNAVSTPNVGDDLSAWTAVINGANIVTTNGKHIGVAEVDAQGKAVQFSDATAVVEAEAVQAPALVNGLNFADDDANDNATIITLGAPSVVGNTFVYKISDNDEAVPTPNVGDDLSGWTAVANGASIVTTNGKHIGIAEIDGDSKAVQFSDATAVVEAEAVQAPALTNGVSFADDDANDNATIITLGAPSVVGNTFAYKISDNDEAVPTPNVGDDLSAWTAVINGASIVTVNGKHIGVAEIDGDSKAVQFSDATAVVEAEAVLAPALTNGVNFADDDANDNATIITLGAPSVVGNTFVYKISDDDNAVSTPNVGDDLSAWTAVINGASIVTVNGKHIGVAEVDAQGKAVQFSDAIAVVEEEAVQAPALTNGLSFADDDANDNATIITLGAPSVVGNTFAYKISDDDNAVSTPNVGDDLSAWTVVINGASIVTVNGKHIGVAEIDGDSEAVQFSDATAIVEAEAVSAPALTNGLSFADDDANDNATIITLGAPSVVGNTFAYKISDDDNAVSTPNVGDDLSAWTAVINGASIVTTNGKHIGVAEVDAQGKAVQFSDAIAVVEEEAVQAPALTNGLSFADDDANDNATIITLGAPSVVGNTFAYKISDNDEAVPTPNVGDDLSGWTAVANGASIVTVNGKHIGVAEVDAQGKAVQFSDATAVVEAEAVSAPALTNGLSFTDDDANDNATIITLGAPSVGGNTFAYKISDDDNAVSTPNVGDDLSAWTAVINGASIVTTNGKHIGVAEIDGDSKAVQFSDATAVVEVEAVQAPALTNGLSFADDDANDNATIITLGAPSVVGNTFVYKISDNDEAVSTPNVRDDLSAWTAVANGASIITTNGKHIGVAEIDGDSKAVQFSDAPAVVEAEAAVTSFTPLNSATDIALNENLQLTFNEPVEAVAGKNIYIKLMTNGTTVATIPANSQRVTIVGSTVTIDPEVSLATNTQYYVNMDAGAFEDADDNPCTEITGNLTWRFTTAAVDTFAPEVITYNPADDATGVAVDAVLTLVFDENVSAVAGKKVAIREKDGDFLHQELILPIADVEVNNNVVSIDSTVRYMYGMEYYVEIEAGAFEDAAHVPYAGIVGDNTTWTFTTLVDNDLPAIDSLSPLNGAENVAIGSNLVLTLTEDVYSVAEKYLTIYQGDGTEIESMDVALSDQIEVRHKVITINPSVDLENNTLYYVIVDPGAFKDLAHNDFAGIQDSSEWRFTTVGDQDLIPPQYQSAEIFEHSRMTLTFDENIYKTGTDEALKAAVQKSHDGTNFTDLGENDTVTITDNTLIIQFDPIFYSSYDRRIKIDANTLKDSANNILNQEITTEDIDSPSCYDFSISSDYRQITLYYRENIVDNTGGNLKGTISYAPDGVTWVLLTTFGDNVTVTPNGSQLEVVFAAPLSGTQNKLKVPVDTLKDAAGNLAHYELISADRTPPILQNTSLSNGNRTVTLTFNDQIVNDLDTVELLKQAVTYAANGVDFVSLAAGDSVAIENDVNLVITFAEALVGDTGRIKVAANALEDSNYVSVPEIITDPIVTADANPPVYLNAGLSDANTTVTLTFNEDIYSDIADIKDGIRFAADGINFNALTGDDNVIIQGAELIIEFNNPLEGNQNKIRVLGNTLKDFSDNMLDSDITTNTITALALGNETVSVTDPENNERTSDNVFSIQGTATNDGNLLEVKVRLKKNADNKYLSANNGDFTSDNPVDLTVVGTTTWEVTLTGVVFEEGEYTIYTLANDGADGAVEESTFLIDRTPPVLVSHTPTDDAQAVPNDVSFVLNFDSPVYTSPAIKYFRIKKASDGEEVMAFSTFDPQVTGSGTATITIDPDGPDGWLELGTDYYITMDDRTFRDQAWNFTTAITDPEYWNFTTGTASLEYTGSFLEGDNVETESTIVTTMMVTLTDDEFVSGDFDAGVEYTVDHVPNGLTFMVERLDSHNLRLSLVSNANPHDAEQSIENLTLQFNDCAFRGNRADCVENSLKADISVTFFD